MDDEDDGLFRELKNKKIPKHNGTSSTLSKSPIKSSIKSSDKNGIKDKIVGSEGRKRVSFTGKSQTPQTKTHDDGKEFHSLESHWPHKPRRTMTVQHSSILSVEGG